MRSQEEIGNSCSADFSHSSRVGVCAWKIPTLFWVPGLPLRPSFVTQMCVPLVFRSRNWERAQIWIQAFLPSAAASLFSLSVVWKRGNIPARRAQIPAKRAQIPAKRAQIPAKRAQIPRKTSAKPNHVTIGICKKPVFVKRAF